MYKSNNINQKMIYINETINTLRKIMMDEIIKNKRLSQKSKDNLNDLKRDLFQCRKNLHFNKKLLNSDLATIEYDLKKINKLKVHKILVKLWKEVEWYNDIPVLEFPEYSIDYKLHSKV